MTTCKMHITASGERQYLVDCKSVDEWTYEKAAAREQAEAKRHFKKQNGERFKPPMVTMAPDWGWHKENNGKGRHIGQLDDKPNDPSAYCTSRRELIEKAKHKGFTKIEKM